MSLHDLTVALAATSLDLRDYRVFQLERRSPLRDIDQFLICRHLSPRKLHRPLGGGGGPLTAKPSSAKTTSPQPRLSAFFAQASSSLTRWYVFYSRRALCYLLDMVHTFDFAFVGCLCVRESTHAVAPHALGPPSLISLSGAACACASRPAPCDAAFPHPASPPPSYPFR